MKTLSRRAVLYGLGATAALSSASLRLAAAIPEPALYPPMDLSHFDTPITPAPDIRIGYASITWNGDDRQAIADIADLGYPGIQLRANVIPDWERRPRALADELAARRLTFVALSSGAVNIDADPQAETAAHVARAKFLHDCGGLYLQVTDQRPARALAAQDFERLGRRLTEIGKRTADLGIPLGYHNHMGTIGERPEEVERVLDAADERYVKFELDIAHYRQGGGDPAAAIRKHADRLLFLHLKDVKDRAGSPGGYRFVELGQGRVDVKAAIAALRDVKFRGWTVVELDAVPDPGRTPKQCAQTNKNYLIADCGLRNADFNPQSSINPHPAINRQSSINPQSTIRNPQ
jgi:inosose dehydratase